MRLKSEFESLRKRGRFSEPISRAAELHIISTLRPGHGFRLHDFFFGIPLLSLALTLPPASPPRSRGLQRILSLLSPSRGRAFHGKRPEVGLGHIRLEVSSTKRILETKTPRNPTRKSVPPRTRKRTKSGRVRERQNSRIRRPSKSVYVSIQTVLRI